MLLGDIDSNVHLRIKVVAHTLGVPMYAVVNHVFKLGLEQLGTVKIDELAKVIKKK